MAETTVQKYYHYNMARGMSEMDTEVWDGAAPTTVTIQPATDKAHFVESIQLLISDDFAMSATDEIGIVTTAYGTVSALTVLSAGVAVDDLSALIALGDPELYQELTIAAATYHKVVIKFKPPVYLRNSTSPAESVVLEYANTGGGVTAGSLKIAVKYWTIDEDDSGLV